MPINRGDIVKINDTCERGVVTEVSSSYCRVYVYSDDRNRGYNIRYRLSDVSVVEECEPQSSFQLNDIVCGVYTYDDAAIVDRVGRVICCNDYANRVVVEFIDPVTNIRRSQVGHSADGMGKNGYCWRIPHCFLRHYCEFNDNFVVEFEALTELGL